jgi:hypothetical protein
MYFCGDKNVCAKTIGKKRREWWCISVDITDVIMGDFISVKLCVYFWDTIFVLSFQQGYLLGTGINAQCTLKKLRFKWLLILYVLLASDSVPCLASLALHCVMTLVIFWCQRVKSGTK